MLCNTRINNTLAWKVAGNWQATVRSSILCVGYSATLIYDSLHLEFQLPLWKTTDWQSHTHNFCSSLSFACKGITFFFFLRGQRSSQQLKAAEPCLWMKQLGSRKSKAVNEIPSSVATQSEGVPWWKEKQQGCRKWLLKRCVLLILAIRQLNSLNNHRVFLTYIHVPELLLQIRVGKGK